MSEHTPGPWFRCASDTYRWQIEAEVRGKTVVLARVTTPPRGGGAAADANALLFAAAPDLLAACRAQHEALDQLFAVDPDFFPTKSGQPWKVLLEGEAAIKRATEGS